jgi:hypothetical protein
MKIILTIEADGAKIEAAPTDDWEASFRAPLPPVVHDFAWVINCLKDRLCPRPGRVRRPNWNTGTYIQANGSIIYYHDGGDTWPWSTRMEDLEAMDWELV